MVKLFEVGFPLNIEKIELVKMFSVFAEITTIKIVRDKISKKCNGYAFLETTGIAGAEMAIDALYGKMMVGKALTVRIADEPVQKPVYKAASKYVKIEKFQAGDKKKRPRKIN